MWLGSLFGVVGVAQYLGGRTMKKTDQKSLDELERKERLLSRKTAVIEQTINSRWERVRACLRPFEVRVGRERGPAWRLCGTEN